jgi:6-phosphogluconolactonase
VVALSGGSTPKGLYQLLASERLRDLIAWKKVLVFFGDERFVSPESTESNFRMVNEALLSRINIPAENIHRYETEATDAELAARDYEKTLRSIFEETIPRFDLILLGLGTDAHTASLFPKTKAIFNEENLVAANYVEKLKAFRLTFTPKLINNSRNVIFLVAGKEKREALQKVLRGTDNPGEFPAQIVRPTDGNLLWLVEESAMNVSSE